VSHWCLALLLFQFRFEVSPAVRGRRTLVDTGQGVSCLLVKS
jgi:hypothetical protein